MGLNRRSGPDSKQKVGMQPIDGKWVNGFIGSGACISLRGIETPLFELGG